MPEAATRPLQAITSRAFKIVAKAEAGSLESELELRELAPDAELESSFFDPEPGAGLSSAAVSVMAVSCDVAAIGVVTQP